MSHDGASTPGPERSLQDDSLEPESGSLKRPLKSLNPTQATFRLPNSADTQVTERTSEPHGQTSRPPTMSAPDGGNYTSQISYKWTSRNNRKGRHKLLIRESPSDFLRQHLRGAYLAPAIETSSKAIWQNIRRMLFDYNFWDSSYLVAIVFVAGCIVLVINAFLSFLPYENGKGPSTEMTDASAILTVFGCGFFLISSFLNYLEAVNANQDPCMGWKVEEDSDTTYGGTVSNQAHSESKRIVPDTSCRHHHSDRSNVFSARRDSKPHDASNEDDALLENDSASSSPWKVIPNYEELAEHFIRDIGFLACTLLLISSIIYFTASICALVSILKTESIQPWIRIPQIVAAAGFVGSYVLFMVETQPSWSKPAVGTLGWWYGLLSGIGSAGFGAAAGFGLKSMMWWTGCWYLVGSWSLLAGSLLQWYEAMDKYPVEMEKAADEHSGLEG